MLGQNTMGSFDADFFIMHPQWVDTIFTQLTGVADDHSKLLTKLKKEYKTFLEKQIKKDEKSETNVAEMPFDLTLFIETAGLENKSNKQNYKTFLGKLDNIEKHGKNVNKIDKKKAKEAQENIVTIFNNDANKKIIAFFGLGKILLKNDKEAQKYVRSYAKCIVQLLLLSSPKQFNSDMISQSYFLKVLSCSLSETILSFDLERDKKIVLALLNVFSDFSFNSFVKNDSDSKQQLLKSFQDICNILKSLNNHLFIFEADKEMIKIMLPETFSMARNSGLSNAHDVCISP